MANKTILRNTGTAPLSLPYPFRGIIPAGNQVVIDAPIATVRAQLGGASFHGGIELLEVAKSASEAFYAGDVLNPLPPGPPGPGVDVQTFTGQGTYTWTKPAGAKLLDIYIFPPGGAGGSGRNAGIATGVANAAGGQGGAPGNPKILRGIDATTLASTIAVTIGAAPTGGAAQATALTNGNPGTGAAACSFGSILSALPGTNGVGGTTASTAARTGLDGFDGTNALSGTAAAQTSSGGAAFNAGAGGTGATLGNILATGGGAGGGLSFAAGTPQLGGAGGANIISSGGIAGNASADGNIGVAQPTGLLLVGGTGAGGGGSNNGANGGAGKKGGFPSGGGSGGGAVVGAGFSSGPGGDGGEALIIAITNYG